MALVRLQAVSLGPTLFRLHTALAAAALLLLLQLLLVAPVRRALSVYGNLRRRVKAQC